MDVRAGCAAVATGLFLLAACAGGPTPKPGIGEAYVGPAELKIRRDIPVDSPPVATVHHGDRLEILQQRRTVFLRVRTPKGAEGWTDARQLLAASDMTNLRDLAERARKMVSQGVATTFGDLRVHTLPTATAPSFLLIKDGEKFDVLGHVISPKIGPPRPPLVPPAPKKQKTQTQKPAKAPKYPLPPVPKPPGPPANWLELSRIGVSEDPGAPTEAVEPPKPVATDDWSLVRMASGQSGWALTRRLYMAVPDEVAQYAEGHRIVSYFSLGETLDGDQKKQDWLWTTISGSGQPYDFDSFRVFIWSLRRHRYETAYIERNLKGYSPVLLQEVDLSTAKTKGLSPAAVKYPGFSLCVEKADGQRYRRQYAFMTNIVRFAGERPCEAAEPLLPGQPAAGAAPAAPAPANALAKQPLKQRIRQKWNDLTRRFFKR